MNQPGDDSGNRNSKPPFTNERIFQNYQGKVGGAFPHVAIHGPERVDGEDVYGWVYQAERFFEVQGLITTGERLPGKSSKDVCYTVFNPHKTGFPLPMNQPGDDSGNRNSKPPFTNERIFQNYQGNTYGQVGGAFPHVAIHGPERGWHPGSDHRFRKLKMPLFDGEDVYGWVYQAERFFEVQGLITTGERLRAAVLSLEGSALSWFRWTNNREPFISWEELKRRLLHRFQSSQDGNLHEQFFSISQQGTAREYVTLFERMAAQLPGLQEEVLEGIFIKGLKQDLRTAIRTQKPTWIESSHGISINH
ncbi:Ankyrin repeat-containing protein [Artemisia annua]|uniref:Ankyrin repeat-containing protein n=1 Tax=Artemisia annua TaxID=35608 RepID=A0A2U1PL28_ARTAN|nr:Ankyrin repeat-containing protein [Artemisia annua]